VFNKFPQEILFVPAAIELWATGGREGGVAGLPRCSNSFIRAHRRRMRTARDSHGAESDGPFVSAVCQGDIS
jgi:hypothetical protein